MRVVVHGQQAFGRAVLEKLLERGENVVAVCTAPDKEGRPADPLKELDECPVAFPLDTCEYDAPDPDATSAAHRCLSDPRKSAQHAAPVLRV